MKNFILEETAHSPRVEFDTEGIFIIKGRSSMVNPAEFFEPVLAWINEFANTAPQKVELKVDMDFFNTRTAIVLHTFFKQLQKMYSAGTTITILWYCERQDTDMIESGNDYASLLSCPFEIIEKE